MVVIKSNIPHYELSAPSLTHFKAVGVVIDLLDGPLVIISIYISPQLKLISNYIHSLKKLSDNSVILGDFNCRHTG